jgi:hypothetical protein
MTIRERKAVARGCLACSIDDHHGRSWDQDPTPPDHGATAP